MRFLRIFLVVIQIGLLMLGLVFAFFSRNLPDIEIITEIKLTNPMRVYTKDKKLIGQFGTEKREIIKFEEIPKTLKNAIIAAEDGDFYQHSGVKLTSLLRATYGEVTGQSLGGGGTITMQVVRNYVLNFERTYERKIKEIILAFQLEDILSKEEIFELYFNKAFLGNRNYGFAAAYQYYFGKDFREATNSEAALLAGILQQPSRVNPVRNPSASKLKRNTILNRMYIEGFITEDELFLAQNEEVSSNSYGPKIEVEASHLAEKIRTDILNLFGSRAYEDGFNIYTTIDSNMQENAVNSVRENLYLYQDRYGWSDVDTASDFNFQILKSFYDNENLYLVSSKLNYSEALQENLDNIRLRLSAFSKIDSAYPSLVISVYDSEILLLDQNLESSKLKWEKSYSIFSQNDSFKDFLQEGSIIYLKENGSEKKLIQIPTAEAALVAMDSLDGSIKAYVGGYDFSRSKYDRASNSDLLLGSSIKPFIYACAFENGIDPATIFIDGPIAFEDELLEEVWRPRNNSGTFYGPIRLRESLIQSLNLVTIKLVRYIGLDLTLDCLKKYRFANSAMSNNLSVGLGTGSLNPLKYVESYSLLINEGNYKKAKLIDRVENLEGDIIYDPNRNYSKEIIDQSQINFPWMSEIVFDELNMPMLKLSNQKDPNVMDSRVAFIVRDILKEALNRNAKRRNLKLPISDIGGKTGTTNNATSTWFSGYASNIVASVWVGKDDYTSLGANEFGSTIALPIWLDFVANSSNGFTQTELMIPEGISVVRIDSDSGQISNTFSNSLFEYFLEENLEKILADSNSDYKDVFN